jgi:glucose-6-phosphate 1-dehydrogenase
MKGDLTLFARCDEVEAMWEFVEPILEKSDSVEKEEYPNYEAGSWGPKASNNIIESDDRKWRIR